MGRMTLQVMSDAEVETIDERTLDVLKWVGVRLMKHVQRTGHVVDQAPVFSGHRFLSSAATGTTIRTTAATQESWKIT